MTEPTYHNVTQGTDEWHALRCGIVTASELNLILTPTLKLADNDKMRKHVWEIAAQRITKYTEPTYIGDAMLRGKADEITARDLYTQHFEPVEEVGFITRVIEGVTVGFSPDGKLIMRDAGIEVKSRDQKFQVEVVASNEIPKEHILQTQGGLLVSGWDFIDYISYSGGMPMWVIRSEPIAAYQDAITEAVVSFEAKVQDVMARYYDRLKGGKVIETERTVMDVMGAIE